MPARGAKKPKYPKSRDKIPKTWRAHPLPKGGIKARRPPWSPPRLDRAGSQEGEGSQKNPGHLALAWGEQVWDKETSREMEVEKVEVGVGPL